MCGRKLKKAFHICFTLKMYGVRKLRDKEVLSDKCSSRLIV